MLTYDQKSELSARMKAIELTLRNFEQHAHGVGDVAAAVVDLSKVVRLLVEQQPAYSPWDE
jgi:hypothetical protein